MEGVNAVDLLQKRAARESEVVAKALGLEKSDDLAYDLARLAAFDAAALDTAALKTNRDEYLNNLTRQNVQLLIHHVFSCPSEPFENGRIAKLPAAVFPLPRSKPVPKLREPTRWEKFAKEKGIQKKKKGKMVFDEASKEYKPRFGYKRANGAEDDWLIEAGENDQPGEDPFLKAREEKRARVAKQKKKEDRNLLERTNPELAKQVYQHGTKKLTQEEKSERRKMQQASIELTQVSTGSLGKFDQRVQGEKAPKPLERVKRAPVISDAAEEKTRALKVLDKVIGGSADFNSAKAANRFIAFEQKQAAEENRKRRNRDKDTKGGKKKRH